MADVNANMESSDEEEGTEEPKGPDLSDTEVDEAEPIKTPAPVKVNFSHVHREYEVSVFFTRFMNNLVK